MAGILTHLTMAGLAGAVLFAVTPLLAHLLYGPEAARGIVNTWVGMGMSALGRGVLLVREHGGVKLAGSSFDPDLGETVKSGGETMHFEAAGDGMGWLQGRPFGIALEKYDVIVRPSQALASKRFHQLVESGDDRVTIDHDDPQDTTPFSGERTYFRRFFRFETGKQLVPITHARRGIQGSARPTLKSLVKEFTRIAQSPYDTASRMQWLALLAAFGVGVGTMIVARRLVSGGGGGGGSVPTQPVMIDAVSVAGVVL